MARSGKQRAGLRSARTEADDDASYAARFHDVIAARTRILSVVTREPEGPTARNSCVVYVSKDAVVSGRILLRRFMSAREDLLIQEWLSGLREGASPYEWKGSSFRRDFTTDPRFCAKEGVAAESHSAAAAVPMTPAGEVLMRLVNDRLRLVAHVVGDALRGPLMKVRVPRRRRRSVCKTPASSLPSRPDPSHVTDGLVTDTPGSMVPR